MPAFDEEARLPRLLEILDNTAGPILHRCGFDFLEAVIIDDGSSDRTAEILEGAEPGMPELHPVLGEGHRGKGAAVAAGLRAAAGEYSLLTDIDLSTPLEDLAQLAEGIRDGADVVIGSRDVEGSRVEAPRHRRQGGRVFNAYVRTVTGLRLRDTQCGFKLMRTSLARELTNGQLCEGFAFDVELLVRARASGFRIAEVPVTYLHDPHSRVRMATASPRMLFDVARLAVKARRWRRAERAREGYGAV